MLFLLAVSKGCITFFLYCFTLVKQWFTLLELSLAKLPGLHLVGPSLWPCILGDKSLCCLGRASQGEANSGKGEQDRRSSALKVPVKVRVQDQPSLGTLLCALTPALFMVHTIGCHIGRCHIPPSPREHPRNNSRDISYGYRVTDCL